MCFNTLKTVIKAKKATKNIYAFKMLKEDLGVLKSPVRNFRWKIGDIANANLPQKLMWKGQNINTGLHCCKSASSARHYSGFLTLVVIPKGSYYYENKTQYVSDKMAILGKYTPEFKDVIKLLGVKIGPIREKPVPKMKK